MGTTRRRIELVALLAACGSLSACGSSTAPDPDAGVTIDADVRGTLSLAWSLSNSETGAPIDCGAVGAAAVSVGILPSGGLVGTVESFPCGDGAGTSGALAPGVYDLTFRLVSAAGELARVEQRRVEVPASGMATATAEFEVLARGNFTFSIDAGAAGGNCAAVADDGAGIVAVQLELLDAAAPATCLPATFDVGGAAYSTTCSGEVFDGCIDDDTVISVTGASSGQRNLRVIASRTGPAACYRTVQLFRIAGNDFTINLGDVSLSLDDNVPGCGPEDMIHAGP